MRNESGDYNCTLTHESGYFPSYVVMRYAVVTINVQCESVNETNGAQMPLS